MWIPEGFLAVVGGSCSCKLCPYLCGWSGYSSASNFPSCKKKGARASRNGCCKEKLWLPVFMNSLWPFRVIICMSRYALSTLVCFLPLKRENIFEHLHSWCSCFFKCSTLDTLSGKTQINHVCFLQHHSLLSPLSPSSSSFLLMFQGVLVAGCRAQGLPQRPCLLHPWAQLNDRLSSVSCVCPCTLPPPGLLLGNNLKSPHSSSLKALFFLLIKVFSLSLINSQTNQETERKFIFVPKGSRCLEIIE